MCSVVGCDSGRRSAERFKIPEDPERRLEWVQFLFEVNGQQLKEAHWTDITICGEHFTKDCFVNPTPATGTVQLKCSAVPSLNIKTEPDEPEPDQPVQSLQCVEPVESKDAACQCDDLLIYYSTTSLSGKSIHTLTESLFSVSDSSDVSNAISLGSDLKKEKDGHILMKGKYVVNENCLLQLFRHKCPTCDVKLLAEKITCGMLIILNQQCPQCDYRYQWKSQVNANIPAAVEKHLKRGTGVTSETQQETAAEDDPSSRFSSEIISLSDEESDPSEEGEEDDKGGASSDGEWNLTEEILLAEELTKESEDESEGEGEEEEDFDSQSGLKISELCTDCGSFYTLKPHTCEYKVKPFSCSICGKRCVTEISLKIHSRIHDETYEHPCKYCYVTFKTRVDKLKHEQTHQDSPSPYKCPDCPKMFSSIKERNVHLSRHRTPDGVKCGVCGIEFSDLHHLRRHSVVHTGLKPYKCSVCQRSFNQSSNLKSHMRMHTGERPFQCQHCDKCFNHNVSLKSHVQRYHTENVGLDRNKGKRQKLECDSGVAKGNGNKEDSDYEFDSDEEEQSTEEAEQKKSKKRRTGRPRGRPKRNAAGDDVLSGGKNGSNNKTTKPKVQKSKKTVSSDEESENEQTDSDASFDTAEEVEETGGGTLKKSKGGSRGQKNDSDIDFDPDKETKKRKNSSQSSGRSSGKLRGRAKKNLEV
ncbi:zinc finger protein 778-like [Notolabrus celidotus]|uniref:zinc finger protein 778-like n=1 Tax=Notolabrus celidotus TaxID=1203425 RepID=UPI00148F72D2|nr:zinc finger protein 778-like [Notolabrus celidotus]